MSTRASKAVILLSTAAVACGLAAAAQAQTAAGPRYMSWAGRPANTTPADVAAGAAVEAQAQAQAQARSGMIPRRVAPSQAVSRPMMQPAPTFQPASRGLTPASAWLGPQPVSGFAPGSPDPLAYTREMTAPVMAPALPPVMAPAPVVAAQPSPPPSPRRLQAADFMSDADAPPMTAAVPVQPAPATVADPMAPRADALIFRLRPQGPTPPAVGAAQPAPQVYAEAAAPTEAQPGQQSSRYYSVHRDAGRTPDRTPLPEAVFFDSVALDLAEPPETQVPQRDAQGRLRAPVRSDDPERP
ncbi:hypothetical protein [Brevundimonas subvibrioides]|uniref:Uncharacterized protein n=1 Tax=Brevundimonas subvibrioides (strain ATCC 15264 / DSM 4735 / LMG 14903 / NBRC 16000 / CB 81) TaxID=633149 RepID=D9QF45_BRESC|nr:hypothetical protein [Brevundimonas subvibrioides]ADL00530.1 hypothetical protein Bresu_1218 [Brevundimonas subvibrioides ATCC 15264]